MLCSLGTAHAQTGLDSLLVQVARNNMALLAGTMQLTADSIRQRTGIQLSDPFINYDYLIGSPATAGNQTDVVIAQPFDFPTTYGKRKQLALAHVDRESTDLAVLRQDILLDAELTGLELIHANKRQAVLGRRLRDAERMHEHFRIALDEGYGNVLDANKAQLHLMRTRIAAQEVGTRIIRLEQHLTELNGGIPFPLTDTILPMERSVPDFATLEQEYEAHDPLLRRLHQEETIAEKQVELDRSAWLPSLEAGYHYQGILGQQYNGVHLGLSIPLWEKQNTVKASKAERIVASLRTEDHRNEHYFEIAELHARYLQLDRACAENRALFEGINSAGLLLKAFELGQLSSIQYFMELTFYNGAEDDHQALELERRKVMARMFKYLL